MRYSDAPETNVLASYDPRFGLTTDEHHALLGLLREPWIDVATTTLKVRQVDADVVLLSDPPPVRDLRVNVAVPAIQ